MRVFVTGATGFVGSAVVKDLLDAGHQVSGLARSEAGAAMLAAAGAQVHRGDLHDPVSLRSGAAASEAVIHTAFIHDFAKFGESCATDRRTIEVLGAALEGSGRSLIVTSGVALLAPGRIATEENVTPADSPFPRVSEPVGLSMVARGVRASVVRLSPTVHGSGDHGFVPILIGIARAQGVSAYVGDGLNRWPAVHRLDAARLYRLALEKGVAGAHYHGVAEEGIAFKAIAEVIGRRLNLPVVAKSAAEAKDHFGWFAMFAGLDCPASSRLSQEMLGWRPTHPTLLTDLEESGYFKP